MFKSPPNGLNMTLDAYLLFSVFYEAWGNPPHHRKLAQSYLYIFEEQIRVACMVLQGLNLVRRDRKIRLGWRPTEALVSLVVKPRRCRKTPKRSLTAEEVKALNVILDWSTREFETRSEIPGFIYPVLHLLGLVKLCDDGCWIPTKRLCEATAESEVTAESEATAESGDEDNPSAG
jgi:hypothetical protein